MAFHQSSQTYGQQSLSTNMGSPLYQRRGIEETGPVELMPNPDFVFPARSAEPSPTLDNWNALNRRPQSSQHPPASRPLSMSARRSRGSASALPNFSFNPSTSTGASLSVATPPHSPNLPSPTSPSRPIGHRRGGSEFIGGDRKGAVLSTSPTKGDGALPPPPAQRLGPPGGARGHRHRRSGAISCHDLQSILQPKDGNSQTRGGSAPATPLEAEQKPFFAGSPRRRPELAVERSNSSPERVPSIPSVESSPQRHGAVPRVRVGFAERVEYIRPLSTISSETEGSMSTIRGHSVSNSMSSVISAGAASPPSARMRTPSLNTTFEDESARPRPQSSGDILDAMTSGKHAFGPQWAVNARPKSAIGSPSFPAVADSTDASKPFKRKSPSWWESRRQHTHTLRSSISEPSLLPSPPSSPSSAQDTDQSSQTDEAAPADSDKPSRKPRKVKSWAHSLISRKSKSNGNLKAKPSRDQEPSPPTSGHSDATSIVSPTATLFHFEQPSEPTFEPNFDIDETVTIVTDARPAVTVPQWRTRDSSESDLMSPVIDLDAALGPFNTPPLGANTRLNVRAPPRARRSMHSLSFHASSLSQNHRRSESAPELVPFELRNSKVAPAAAMPDVFEEEDEEDTVEMASSPDLDGGFVHTMDEVSRAENEFCSEPDAELTDEESTVLTEGSLDIDVHVQQGDFTPDMPSRSSTLRVSAPVALPLRNTSPVQSDPIEVVEDFEEPRASSLTRDSDSTITPPLTAEDEKNPQSLINLSLPLPQQPIMTPDTLSGSSFSSHGFNNSQASLSTPRLGTATSSSTDPRSFSFGEPGPVRMSVDDVPSLSSSRSTMTTPPTNHFPGGNPFGPEGRTSSVYSITSLDERRNTKRASVASLSRLMGGFGEKSKLSIESRPQSQHIMSTTPKVKKANRLSKLLFWKKSNEEKERT
jgi:hypothetical protein